MDRTPQSREHSSKFVSNSRKVFNITWEYSEIINDQEYTALLVWGGWFQQFETNNTYRRAASATANSFIAELKKTTKDRIWGVAT